jgi:hypothetical protein
LTALLAAPVLAQDQGGGGNRPNRGGDQTQGGGNGQGRGNFDPAQFRQRFEDNVKEQLGATDDEWKVIQPKLTKVFDARRASMGGMRGMFGRNRDRGGDTSATDNTNRSPLEIAQRELQQVLDNKDATADQIAAKLKALREARDKAKQELASAQKDLKEILTPRQEAVLVNMSMLD